MRLARSIAPVVEVLFVWSWKHTTNVSWNTFVQAPHHVVSLDFGTHNTLNLSAIFPQLLFFIPVEIHLLRFHDAPCIAEPQTL